MGFLGVLFGFGGKEYQEVEVEVEAVATRGSFDFSHKQHGHEE